MNKKAKEKIEKIIYGIGVDSYNRFGVFLKHCKNFDDCEYWYGLSLAYQCSDNLFQYEGLVRAAFESKRDCRDYLMNKSKKLFLKNLPDEIMIYRAMTIKESKSRRFGVSWTLSKEVAEFFRDKYTRNHATRNEPKIIIEKVVSKENIVAYFYEREEQEIIYL
jgi:hypothetical protein